MKDYSVYLINLDRSKNRLDQFQQQAESCGLPFTRIAAVDGHNPDFSPPAISGAKYFRALTHGEIACYMSHVAVLKQFLAEGIPYAVILEDDCRLAAHFIDKLNQILVRHQHNPCWNILRLHGRKKGRLDIDVLSDDLSLVEYVTIPSGTMGAVWTRAGAEAFLNHHKNSIGQRPIDVDLRYPWEFGGRILTVVPPLVLDTEHSHQSSIGQKQPLHNLASKLPRIMKKLRYQIYFTLKSRSYTIRRHGLWTNLLLELNQQHISLTP